MTIRHLQHAIGDGVDRHGRAGVRLAGAGLPAEPKASEEQDLPDVRAGRGQRIDAGGLTGIVQCSIVRGVVSQRGQDNHHA